MTVKKGKLPSCFGDLSTVFPEGDDGLRESPESCMICCHYKTECLRKALGSGEAGIKARQDHVDKAYSSGMMGFMERWSKKKHLSMQLEKNKKSD